MIYIPRAIESTLRRTSDTFPVLMLTGARQTGKTTVLRHLSDSTRTWVTLDDPLVRHLAQDEPSIFMERYKPPVAIDEIQYAPQLFPYIKMAVDRTRENGAFWLTGSQTFLAMREVTQSLAGRVGLLTLGGLSNAELQKANVPPFRTEAEQLLSRRQHFTPLATDEIFERIHKGSMPALWRSDACPDWHLFYSSYVQTYLQRDVSDLAKVIDTSSFFRFLTVTAARTGQQVNYADLAREADVTGPTAKAWLSVLQGAGLIVLLPPWQSNVANGLAKKPKLYFLDTGLAAWLTRWPDSTTLAHGPAAGAFFETWVFSQIWKSFADAGQRPPLYYYRDHRQREIDLLIAQGQVLYPIEIKKTSSPRSNDARHFTALDEKGVQRGQGVIIAAVTDLLPCAQDLWLYPAWGV